MASSDCVGPDCNGNGFDEEGTPEPDNNQFDDSLNDTGLDGLLASMGENTVVGQTTLNPADLLPSVSSCQSLSTSFFGHPFTFPDSSQCAKLEQVKTMLSWLVYVLTFYSITMIILGSNRKEVA